MEICCIIENLSSIKTRIHRKTIEGLHDIFRFFCFTLGKNLSLLNRDTYHRDPLFLNLLQNHRKSPAHFPKLVETFVLAGPKVIKHFPCSTHLKMKFK